eukprot:2748418-Amphidinium_carterae.1
MRAEFKTSRIRSTAPFAAASRRTGPSAVRLIRRLICSPTSPRETQGRRTSTLTIIPCASHC